MTLPPDGLPAGGDEPAAVELPLEADELDAVDQTREVPLDDDVR